ncbi:MAG: hypothetical protein Kow0069_20160 [Promethearchaeota archaeon]
MGLEKLLEEPRDRVVAAVTVAAAAAFLVVNFLFEPCNSLMAAAGAGILDFEFAWTAERAEEILAGWLAGSGGGSVVPCAVHVNVVDFAYMPAYGFTGFGLVVLVTRRLSGGWRRAGLRLALLPLVAAAFDVVENVNLLVMLGSVGAAGVSSVNPVNAALASACATIKFAALLAAIGFFAAALAKLAASRKSSTE